MDLRRGPPYANYEREIETGKGRYQIRRRKGGAGARRAAKEVRAQGSEKWGRPCRACVLNSCSVSPHSVPVPLCGSRCVVGVCISVQ